MKTGDFNLVPNETFWKIEARTPLDKSLYKMKDIIGMLGVSIDNLIYNITGNAPLYEEPRNEPTKKYVEHIRYQIVQLVMQLSVLFEKINVAHLDCDPDLVENMDVDLQRLVEQQISQSKEQIEELLKKDPIYPELETLE